MKALLLTWKANKLEGSMKLCFLAAVFASFFGTAILSFSVPGVGEVYPFRVLLLVTAILYFVWCIRGKDPFWKSSSWLEKWCYILIASTLVYSTISLLWAMDFMFSFRRWFNLCFDLCFFFLLLRLCREKKFLKVTMIVTLAAAAIVALMGFYEVFNGGIFSSENDGTTWFAVFMKYYQHPKTCFTSSNEFSATLVLIGSVVLLGWALRKRKDIPVWQVWVIIFSIPFVWFLLLASAARLCQIAFLIVLVGFMVYMFFRNWKKGMLLLIAVLLVGCVQFAHQYRDIVPPLQKYLAEMKEYREQMAGLSTTPPPASPTAESVVTPPPTEAPTVPKPTLNIDGLNPGLKEEEFLIKDKETGKTSINQSASGGIRLGLLLHAFRCFTDSYGLGCGLGNTEQLALANKVVGNEKTGYFYSIHCFVARIIADCGIFVLIPLCAIAFLLLKKGWRLFVSGMKARSWESIGLSFLYVCCLLAFPLASTASSDAQDLHPMWIYLATIVLFASLDFGRNCPQNELTGNN